MKKNEIDEIEKINNMKDKLKNSKTINLSLVNRNIIRSFERKSINQTNSSNKMNMESQILQTEKLKNNNNNILNQKEESESEKKQKFNIEVHTHSNEIFEKIKKEEQENSDSNNIDKLNKTQSK